MIKPHLEATQWNLAPIINAIQWLGENTLKGAKNLILH
jgi:hypothetical protein